MKNELSKNNPSTSFAMLDRAYSDYANFRRHILVPQSSILDNFVTAK